jgi:RNA polymerase sigma factor (sigma-70 family)
VSSDGEIFQRSIRDPEAFREIFERHATIVLAYARKRLGTTSGDEVLAETFLTAFERRSRFDTTYVSARPWLFGIATNMIRHHLREEQEYLRALGKVAPDPPAYPTEDDTRLDAERMRPQLIAAMMTLSQEDRDTFLLLALGDFTYEEIAQALGIPIGTVRSRIHRTRARLREQLPFRTAIGDETPSTHEEPWTSSS